MQSTDDDVDSRGLCARALYDYQAGKFSSGSFKKGNEKKKNPLVFVQCVSMCGRCVARKKNCKPRHQKVKDQLEQITVGNKMFFAS